MPRAQENTINPECFNCPMPDCNPEHPNCPLQKETVTLRMKKTDARTLKEFLAKKTGQRLDAGIIEMLEVVAGRIRAKR
jgi:hypothetical protein